MEINLYAKKKYMNKIITIHFFHSLHVQLSIEMNMVIFFPFCLRNNRKKNTIDFIHIH